MRHNPKTLATTNRFGRVSARLALGLSLLGLLTLAPRVVGRSLADWVRSKIHGETQSGCVECRLQDRDWDSLRGVYGGTQRAAGHGSMDDVSDGHHPNIVWKGQYGVTGPFSGSVWPVNVDADSGIELVGLLHSRVVLWDDKPDASGLTPVLARSRIIPLATIEAVTDIDGDGRQEVVVLGQRTGGGVVVLDAETMTVRWSSPDAGRNGGERGPDPMLFTLPSGNRALLWRNQDYVQINNYHLAEFRPGSFYPFSKLVPSGWQDGLYQNLFFRVAGNLRPIDGHPSSILFLIQQQILRLLDLTQNPPAEIARYTRPIPPGVSDDQSHTFADTHAVDLDGDGDEEVLVASSIHPNSIEVTAFDPQSQNFSDPILWSYSYGADGTETTPYNVPEAIRGVRRYDLGSSPGVGAPVVAINLLKDGSNERVRFAGQSAWSEPGNYDCLSTPSSNSLGAVIFDGVNGHPLASQENLYFVGHIDWQDTAHQSRTLLVAQQVKPGTRGDSDRLLAYELQCNHDWRSCDDTGCALKEVWSLADSGLIPYRASLLEPQTTAITRYAFSDLNADGRQELILTTPDYTRLDAIDLVPQSDTSFKATTLASIALGPANYLTRIVGTGTDTRIVLQNYSPGAGEPGLSVVLMPELSQSTFKQVSTLKTYESNGASVAITGRMRVPSTTSNDCVTTMVVGQSFFCCLGDHTGGLPETHLTLNTGERAALFANLYDTSVDDQGKDELLTYTADSVQAYSLEPDSSTGQLGLIQHWKYDVNLEEQTSDTWSVYPSDDFDHPALFTTGDFGNTGSTQIAFVAKNSSVSSGASGYTRMVLLDSKSGSPLATSAPVNHATYGRDLPLVASTLIDGTPALFHTHVTGQDVYQPVLSPGAESLNHIAYLSTLGTSTLPAFYGGESLLADVNHDGEQELVIVDPQNIRLYSLPHAGDDGVPTPLWIAPRTSYTNNIGLLAVADVGGDGTLEILVGGAYGELSLYSADSGQQLWNGCDNPLNGGCPFYLQGGKGSFTPGSNAGLGRPLPIRQLAVADISGDGTDDALVAHQDSCLYAVSLTLPSPSLLWVRCFDAPVDYVRVFDADYDPTEADDPTHPSPLEILVLPEDGTAYVLDSGPQHVSIQDIQASQQELGECVDGNTIMVSGTITSAEGTLELLWNGRVLSSTPIVSAGPWRQNISSDSVGKTQGQIVLEVRVLNAKGEEVETQSQRLSYGDRLFSDDDGDKYSPCRGDCDDSNPQIGPQAIEVSDGLDTNCDGIITEDDGCADFSPQSEICDGLDNDCNGIIDNVDQNTDHDQDGYTQTQGDCNDCNANQSPAEIETCDGLDNNCDGIVDSRDPTRDDDADGYTEQQEDCNDCSASQSPVQVESCDGIDNDCDGLVDESSTACGTGPCDTSRPVPFTLGILLMPSFGLLGLLLRRKRSNIL